MVDPADDVSRLRHLSRRAGHAKCVLHVDDDESAAPRVEPVEPMITSAAGENAIDDILPDRNLVHGTPYPGERRRCGFDNSAALPQ
jgi:hypothetical protein